MTVANSRFRLPVKTLGHALYLGSEYIPSAGSLAPGPQDDAAGATLAVVTGEWPLLTPHPVPKGS